MQKFHRLNGVLLFQLLWISLNAQGPEIFVDIWRYQQISGNTFERNGKVEVYFRAAGNSLHFLPTSSEELTAQIQVSYIIQKIEGFDSIPIIQRQKKLDQKASKIQSDQQKFPSIIDFEEFSLSQGNYILQVKALDLQAENPKIEPYNREFLMRPPAQAEFAFSDIALLQDDPIRMRLKKQLEGEDYEPQGRFFTPLITNESLVNQDSLVCYVQLYNATQLAREGQILERARITKNGRNVYEPYTEVEQNPRNFQVFVHTFDISRLSNDTYHLTIDVLDNSNKVLRTIRKKFYLYNYQSEKDFKFFVNDVYTGDLLNEFSDEEIQSHIQSLRPISEEQEIQFAQVLRTYQQRKNYVYSFWNRRKENDLSLAELVNGYKAVVTYVNDKFSNSSLPGWQTDQGRIWLRYGPPHNIEQYPSTRTELAYEIWRYERLSNQKNVVFIFFQPEEAESRMQLIHSDKYGETRNPRWRSSINKARGGRFAN